MLSRLVIFVSAVEYSFEKDYVVGKRKKRHIIARNSNESSRSSYQIHHEQIMRLTNCIKSNILLYSV